MKPMEIISLAAAALSAGSIAAAPCRTCRTVVVDVQRVQQVQTLFLVAPPSYYGAVNYSPPAVAAGSRASNDAEIVKTLGEIAATLARLQTRVVALEEPAWPQITPPPPPPPPPQPVPAFAAADLIEQRCAKCHTGDEPAGKFSLAELSLSHRADLARAYVANSKMPLDGDNEPIELTPDDRQKLLEAFDTLKARN